MPYQVKCPQEYSNWKPYKGKRSIEYTADTSTRRRKRNVRRKTLMQKAHELAVISGGQVFVLYIDDNSQSWTYSSSDELWNKYSNTGLKLGTEEKRCDGLANVINISPKESGQPSHARIDKRVSVPTPTRTSRLPLNFTTLGAEDMLLDDADFGESTTTLSGSMYELYCQVVDGNDGANLSQFKTTQVGSHSNPTIIEVSSTKSAPISSDVQATNVTLLTEQGSSVISPTVNTGAHVQSVQPPLEEFCFTIDARVPSMPVISPGLSNHCYLGDVPESGDHLSMMPIESASVPSAPVSTQSSVSSESGDTLYTTTAHLHSTPNTHGTTVSGANLDLTVTQSTPVMSVSESDIRPPEFQSTSSTSQSATDVNPLAVQSTPAYSNGIKSTSSDCPKLTTSIYIRPVNIDDQAMQSIPASSIHAVDTNHQPIGSTPTSLKSAVDANLQPAQLTSAASKSATESIPQSAMSSLCANLSIESTQSSKETFCSADADTSHSFPVTCCTPEASVDMQNSQEDGPVNVPHPAKEASPIKESGHYGNKHGGKPVAMFYSNNKAKKRIVKRPPVSLLKSPTKIRKSSRSASTSEPVSLLKSHPNVRKSSRSASTSEPMRRILQHLKSASRKPSKGE